MGNNIASAFIQRLRISASGSTLVSQTSATSPLFVDPNELKGVARAYVVFDGIVPAGTVCPIVQKSSYVTGVTAQATRGDYLIGFEPGTFADRNYMVTGSVFANSTNPISAANTFFVKSSGYSQTGFISTPGAQWTETSIRIQTVNASVTSTPAYASRVSLLFYK